jgi:hypothetical protein
MRRMRIRHVVLGGLGALVLAGLFPVPGTAAPILTTGPLAGWGSTQSQAATNKAITDRIHAEQAILASAGAELTEWGPDAASGKVKVYLTHYSDAARRLVQARYGSDVVVATQSLPRPFVQVDRRHDEAPFFGGDYIFVVDNFKTCTSGPIVRNADGQLRMLTAGHCVEVGDSISTTANPAVFMGTVQRRQYCELCIDSAVVSGNYLADVWGGGPSGANVYCEDGGKFVPPSEHVAVDGARTGEHRNTTVQAINQNVTFNDGITRVSISKTTKPDATLTLPGDSGGPVFQHEPNADIRVQVAGTIVGGNEGDTAYYQQQNSINTQFNVIVPSAC